LKDLDFTSLRACKKIGLFDSGIGGLSVLRKLADLSSNALPVNSEVQPIRTRQFFYLGDTARCPYGDRSNSEIVSFVNEIISWLTISGAEAIVMACNTSAATSLESARKTFDLPIFDLITPTAHKVADLGLKVGVMATASTIRSKAFSKSIHALSPQLPVVEMACPDLVPLVESGKISEDATISILKGYIEKLRREGVEALILGCTHFPFFAPVLKTLVKDQMILIDPAQVLADLVYADDVRVPFNDSCKLFVTGDAFQFAQTAEICLGYNIGTISSVNVEEVVGSTRLDSVSSLSNFVPGSASAKAV
jgi:glutamate racemase